MSSDAATSAPDHAPVATAATTDASQAASDSKPTQTPSSTDASAAQEQTADDARANGETLTGAAGESESAQADKAAQGGSTATTKDDALTLRALVSSKEAGQSGELRALDHGRMTRHTTNGLPCITVDEFALDSLRLE